MDRFQYEQRKAANRLIAYQDAMRPFYAAKLNALSCMMPIMVIRDGEMIERYYKPSDQVLIDRYDQMIECMRSSVLRALDVDVPQSP